MKRVVVLLVIMVAILAIPPSTYSPPYSIEKGINPQQGPRDYTSVSSTSGTGDSRTAVVFGSKQVNSLSLPIMNSYASTGVHSGSLDLSSYLIPGWSLYEVEIEVDSITAVAERETMGITPNTYMTIQNYTGSPPPPVGTVTDALYQEFYNQPHDGKLENYSIVYISTYYVPSLGHAFLGVRSNYSDPNTNTTGWVTPFTSIFTDTIATHDCSSDNAILNSSTPYFVVIDGTAMYGVYSGGWRFNEILWKASSTVLGLETGYSLRDQDWYIYDGIDRHEALLNYTYTPWNETSNSALVYASPTQVSLTGNSTDLQGTSWTFTDPDNITLINFNSNQSLSLAYSITLWYKQSATTTASWSIPTSGADVEWSVETTIEYPETTQVNYLNISIPETWDSDGFYNSTHPSNNHTSFSSTRTMITCSQVYNDTWILELTSKNLMKTLKTYTTVDDTEVVSQSLMTSNIDINSTLEEPDSDPIATGTINLEIWYSGAAFWTPSDKSVTNGLAHYFWNISEPLAKNGEYTIETYWSNGTEAGYRTKDLLLYYPTTLVASQSQIDAFTESTFDISIDFDDTFTPQGLDAVFASVVYSFDGGTNTSLTDSGGGTWTATIPTTGKANDTYTVVVYAEGYALENRSITLDVTLIHDTQPLVINWSNNNNISYVGSTILSVEYRTVGGSPVTDATVNVTDGSTWWELTHVGSGIYNYTFNGSNPDLDFITHDLTIQAWQMGYKNQSDATTLTVHRESTTIDIIWIDGSSITFVEDTILRVNYTMSDGSAVLGADINVTIGTGDWNLVWNGATQTYDLTIFGDAAIPGLGIHSVNLFVGRFGYINHTDNSETLSIDLEPTSILIDWLDGNGTITFVQQTTLVVTFRMNNLTPISGAVVNATDGVTDWEMEWDNTSQTYRLTLFGWNYTQGLGSFNLTIRALKTGHAESNGNITLTIIEDPTTITVSWSSGINNITYIESTTLIVSYRMNDTTPIDNATVIASILGVPYPLSWHNDTLTYRYNYTGADSPPGFGKFNLTISAYKFGFENGSNTDHWITLRVEPTSIDITWIGPDTITYLESTILSINYTMQDGSPVTDANVTVAIGSDSWPVDYDIVTKTYRVQFLGTDEPPGLGAFTLAITASVFGFESRENNTVSFTINLEPTSLVISWNPDNDITFATYSILYVDYTLLNSTPIPLANVNLTIGTDYWEIPWNNISQRYQLRINGSDVPPGFANHTMLIQASKKGYVNLNTSDTVLLRIEPTSLVIEWSNGHDLGFFEYTYLLIDFRKEDLGTIYDADLNVTIGTYTWYMTWNATAGRYQIRFNGSDSIPGVGTHNLIIKAGKEGYINQEDTNEILTLPVIPTNLILEFANGNDISYVQQTTLRAFYTMYNGTPVTLAEVNVTIAGEPYSLTWNNGTYEYTFTGSDDPPGFGNHSLTVLAGATDFEGQSDFSRYLNLRIEYTNLDITWSNGYSITYFNQTTLAVRYLMSDQITPIDSAFLNATINGKLYMLSWNITTGAYEATIKGTDDPPGYDTYQVIILASRYGFESQENSSFYFTIRVQDTFLSFEWNPSNSTSYVSYTKLMIFYQMANGSPVIGASVNATYITPYFAVYNQTSKAYEILFQGDDEFLIIGTNSLVIKAWKLNYKGFTDTSQKLIIQDEETSISGFWSDGDEISYIQMTTLYANYTMSNETKILDAWVWIEIGLVYFDTMVWDSDLKLYTYTFRGSDDPPGIGTHGITIVGFKPGYVQKDNSSFILTISAADVGISSNWLNGSLISYVNSTTLEVNYTTSEGVPISGAIVNVTISTDFWELDWHVPSQTYRLTFNGTDNPPGFGTHALTIKAGRDGYNHTTDTTKILTIIPEPTSLTVYWSDPHQNDITYFEHTILFVRYQMSNETDILDAMVNVTILGFFSTLEWNSTEGAYGVMIRGSYDPPGLGFRGLIVRASKEGYYYSENSDAYITLSKDPTSIEVQWPQGNSTTYIGSTSLIVYYRMSNGTMISSGTVTATIGVTVWPVVWNSTIGGYRLVFEGNWDPPGIGIHTVTIDASADIFASQTTQALLEIQKDPTSAIPSWPTYTIDWTQSVVLSVDYLDSLGRLIENATQKKLTVNGTIYTLQGNNGTYWFEFDNSFDLGHFEVVVNISLYGYEFAVNSTISFDIVEAPTTITAAWSATAIDYLGQANLEVSYEYSGGGVVPMGSVKANLTINGITDVVLFQVGDVWVANLTGLDLGTHDIVIRAQAYGYVYMETVDILTVNPVNTDELTVLWTPSNVTIEFTETLELEVDYTFYGGDVPTPAFVNVTIDERIYELVYGGDVWSATILVSELDVGIYDAFITAWAYGYADRTNMTFGINVTLAANLFGVVWEPVNSSPSYLEIINISVIYLEDFVPIQNATVRLSINGTLYDLLYNETDQRWHFSIRASDIGLGLWNVTVTANRTGYADGWDSRILTISPAATNLTVMKSAISIYYDQDVTIDIYYQLLNTSIVPGATLTFEVDGDIQFATWDIDHWTYTRSGSSLGVGVHPVYVHVVAVGFQVATEAFDVSVNEIPTTVTTPSPTISIFAYESTTITFTWNDTKNAVGIGGFVPEVTWPDTYSFVDHGNGTYSIQINSDALHIGSYELQVSFVRTGYENRTELVNVDILVLPIVLVYESEFEQFENESIIIDIQMFDGPHATVVDWGEIIIELEGVQYTLVYNSGTERYSVEIWLSTLAPGSYTLNFTVSAVDCETEYGEIQLEIESKVAYTLTLEVDDEVQTGQSIDISVSAAYESGAVSGLPITIHIVIERGETAPQGLTEEVLTNAEGIALLVFNVPSDASGLTIWAEFEGTIGEWPAISNTVNREVSPGGFDILSFIFSLFEDPVTLIIIMGGGGGSIAGLILLRRRRNKPRVSPPSGTEDIVPPSVTPTAPAGEMDILQDEIKQYPVGLTRSQIAKALDISKSKASVLVRNLLESDPRFEEIAEGRLRRIRFKPDE